jgi:hypothetical protein
MGFWNAITSWFSSGVKVKIQDVAPQVSKKGSAIDGKVNLTSKADKHVNKVVYKLLRRRTHGRGQDKKTEDTVLSQATVPGEFDLKAGESKVMDLHLNYALPQELKDMKGVLGSIGKLGAFADAEKDEVYLVAECHVKGTAFSPSDWLKVSLVD